jgi:hypothetical protein
VIYSSSKVFSFAAAFPPLSSFSPSLYSSVMKMLSHDIRAIEAMQSNVKFTSAFNVSFLGAAENSSGQLSLEIFISREISNLHFPLSSLPSSVFLLFVFFFFPSI